MGVNEFAIVAVGFLIQNPHEIPGFNKVFNDPKVREDLDELFADWFIVHDDESNAGPILFPLHIVAKSDWTPVSKYFDDDNFHNKVTVIDVRNRTQLLKELGNRIKLSPLYKFIEQEATAGTFVLTYYT